jgi:predicted transcriptional regulator
MESKTFLTNTLNIRLTDAHKRALEIMAASGRVSVSEVVRNAIRHEIDSFTLSETEQAELSLIQNEARR